MTARCYAAGALGVTLWPHRVRWAECFAKPQGAVCSFQSDREFGANCRQASNLVALTGHVTVLYKNTVSEIPAFGNAHPGPFPPCHLQDNYNAMQRNAMARPHCHADMETLEMLDLEGNKVDDLGALHYLSWCPQLAVLTLADNPVASDAAYQAQVIKASGHPDTTSSSMCTQCGQ